MKKKKEIHLNLKKVKITSFSTLNSIVGGNETDGDPGTRGNSRGACPPGDNDDDSPGSMITILTCPPICPSILNTFGPDCI